MDAVKMYPGPLPAGLRSPQEKQWREVYELFRRLIDIVVVLFTGPAVLLVIAFAAIAILLTMGRPIFFLGDRVGWKGRTFRMVKLRTMTAGSDGPSTTATLKHDARITPLGRILRRTHFDELPQLWNIFVGDMTLIGPRPEQPHLVDYYRQNIPNYDLRHSVRPGLSGWAQVCFGYATDLAETQQKLTYDLEYVERLGPKIDLLTAAKTIQIYLDPRFVR